VSFELCVGQVRAAPGEGEGAGEKRQAGARAESGQAIRSVQALPGDRNGPPVERAPFGGTSVQRAAAEGRARKASYPRISAP
jgi:hypothetical protein